MINSVPSMDSNELTGFVDSLADVVGNLFIATNTQAFYESIAGDWVDFVKSVPGLGS